MTTLPRAARRRFLALSLGSFATLAVGRTAWRISAVNDGTLTLYDPRFPRALALARQVSAGGGIVPILGDPTEIIAERLGEPLAGRYSRPLQGVTLQSLPFCLVQIRQRVPFLLHQVDNDLYFWRI